MAEKVLDESSWKSFLAAAKRQLLSKSRIFSEEELFALEEVNKCLTVSYFQLNIVCTQAVLCVLNACPERETDASELIGLIDARYSCCGKFSSDNDSYCIAAVLGDSDCCDHCDNGYETLPLTFDSQNMQTVKPSIFSGASVAHPSESTTAEDFAELLQQQQVSQSYFCSPSEFNVLNLRIFQRWKCEKSMNSRVQSQRNSQHSAVN